MTPSDGRATHMRRHTHAASPGGGVHPGARCARLAAAWLLLLAAAGAIQAQTAAAQADQSAGLTPQERSLYLLKAAVNGDTVRKPRLCPVSAVAVSGSSLFCDGVAPGFCSPAASPSCRPAPEKMSRVAMFHQNRGDRHYSWQNVRLSA